MVNSNDILSEVHENGFCILNEFFKGSELDQIQEECEWFLRNERAWYSKTKNDHSDYASICPQSIPIDEQHRIKTIHQKFAQPLFEQTCRGYLGPTGHVNTFIVNRQTTHPSPVTEWHADQAKDGLLSFKYMLYLNDVTDKQGAFSYFPRSHHMVKKLVRHAKALGVPNTEIHDFEQMKKWAVTLNLQDCIDMLKKASEDIRGDFDSDNVHALSARRGSVIAFDPKGLHRGGEVKEGERYLIRVHCFEYPLLNLKSKLKYWLPVNRKAKKFFPVSSASGRSATLIKEYG